MSYEAVSACAAALLRGRELRCGPYSMRRRRDRLAYDQAVSFVRQVGPGPALEAAHRALGYYNELGKKAHQELLGTRARKRIKWL